MRVSYIYNYIDEGRNMLTINMTLLFKVAL